MSNSASAKGAASSDCDDFAVSMTTEEVLSHPTFPDEDPSRKDIFNFELVSEIENFYPTILKSDILNSW